jgi:hypothetical protein
MEDELVLITTAKLAKELGFNEPCYYFGNTQGNFILNAADYLSKTVCTLEDIHDDLFKNASAYNVLVPTQSLLHKWLREKHNVFIMIDINFRYMIYFNDEHLSTSRVYKSYEQAFEEALQDALTRFYRV